MYSGTFARFKLVHRAPYPYPLLDSHPFHSVSIILVIVSILPKRNYFPQKCEENEEESRLDSFVLKTHFSSQMLKGKIISNSLPFTFQTSFQVTLYLKERGKWKQVRSHSKRESSEGHKYCRCSTLSEFPRT